MGRKTVSPSLLIWAYIGYSIGLWGDFVQRKPQLCGRGGCSGCGSSVLGRDAVRGPLSCFLPDTGEGKFVGWDCPVVPSRIPINLLSLRNKSGS